MQVRPSSGGFCAGAVLIGACILTGCSQGTTPQTSPAVPVDPTVAPEHASPVSPAPATAPPTDPSASPSAAGSPPAAANSCLASGDGYFRAHLAGAIEASIDWPNLGTHCEGESKSDPVGVRLSFRRDVPGKPDLLFVFGVTGVEPGAPSRAVGANLTVIVQGTSHIYGTQGDARCTVDSLTQRPLAAPRSFRVEARGFCTSPAHAVRGDGDVLMSTFDFAGIVNYEASASASQAGI